MRQRQIEALPERYLQLLNSRRSSHRVQNQTSWNGKMYRPFLVGHTDNYVLPVVLLSRCSSSGALFSFLLCHLVLFFVVVVDK